jgi:hypothetical protein
MVDTLDPTDTPIPRGMAGAQPETCWRKAPPIDRNPGDEGAKAAVRRLVSTVRPVRRSLYFPPRPAGSSGRAKPGTSASQTGARGTRPIAVDPKVCSCEWRSLDASSTTLVNAMWTPSDPVVREAAIFYLRTRLIISVLAVSALVLSTADFRGGFFLCLVKTGHNRPHFFDRGGRS